MGQESDSGDKEGDIMIKIPDQSVIELERIRKMLESLQNILTSSQQLLYETQQTLIDEILKTVSEDAEFTHNGKDYAVVEKPEEIHH